MLNDWIIFLFVFIFLVTLIILCCAIYLLQKYQLEVKKLSKQLYDLELLIGEINDEVSDKLVEIDSFEKLVNSSIKRINGKYKINHVNKKEIKKIKKACEDYGR